MTTYTVKLQRLRAAQSIDWRLLDAENTAATLRKESAAAWNLYYGTKNG